MKKLMFIFLSFIHIYAYSELPLLHDKKEKVLLFSVYPQLAENISYISLGSFPTPIGRCENFSSLFSDQAIDLYIKHDNQSGKLLSDGTRLFGGNKVRKLEFALADALHKNAQTIITFGCVGSNHATATTIYARELGLKAVCLLSHQEALPVVRRNLCLQYAYGADMRFFPNIKERGNATESIALEYESKEGISPYIIPVGASYPIGALGFVNAAFELKKQIEEGYMPVPDVIYVPAGSLGTMAGLLLGLKLAGLPSKVVGASTMRASLNYLQKGTVSLLNQTNELLHQYDQNIPLFEWEKEDLCFVIECGGPRYGTPTPEGLEAIKIIADTENIALDEVYTGKAFAGLIKDLKEGKLKNKTILFWNTFCSDAFSDIIDAINYKDLKEEFHQYFQ
jgi:D-cysteine desulfhydrase